MVFDPDLGCVGTYAVTSVLGVNVVWSKDGPYISYPSQGSQTWYLAQAIRDQIDALDADDISAIKAIHDSVRHQVLFFAGSSVFIFQYGTGSLGSVAATGIDISPFRIQQGIWFTASLPGTVTVTSTEIVEVDANKSELWVGTNEGWVYRLNDPDQKTWAVGASTQAISSIIETTSQRVGQHPQYYSLPRYFVINGEAGAVQATWNVTITMKDDADARTLGTTTFTATVGPGATSTMVPVPGNNLQGSAVSILLSNAETTVTSTIKSVRMYYLPGRLRFMV